MVAGGLLLCWLTYRKDATDRQRQYCEKVHFEEKAAGRRQLGFPCDECHKVFFGNDELTGVVVRMGLQFTDRNQARWLRYLQIFAQSQRH